MINLLLRRSKRHTGYIVNKRNMRNKKILSTVLTVAVILGIVGCKSESGTELSKDDLEITTTTSVETQKETTENPTTTTETTTLQEESSETVAPETTATSTIESVETTPIETTKKETTVKESEVTSKPKETKAPEVPETTAPAKSTTPAATPTPEVKSTPLPTPVPETKAFNIDQSARENGYEIIDIDMGGGQTQRIYGYYVDMSGLATKINDYREGLGLARLSTDSSCISEMKTRAAEATVKYSHWRPNGQGGQESNLCGSISPSSAYEELYNSTSHRESWENVCVDGIYCTSFRRMVYREDIGEWSESGSATVVYLRDNLL